MKNFKKVFTWIGIVVVVLGLVVGVLYWIYLRPFVEKMKVISTIEYDKELTLVIGGGGNSGILVSDSLVLVVDTKMDDAAKDLYSRVKNLAGNRAVLVINTHIHPDHVGGNKLFKDATVMAGANYSLEQWTKEAGEESLPNKWLKDRLDIKMGSELVSIINFQRNAHTESDVFVYMHQRKLLFGGDVILNKQNPIMMGKADPEGYLAAFEMLPKEFEIEHLVPGHGSFGGIEIIEEFKQYFLDMKLAAENETLKESLIKKYKNWAGIPIFMSPEATIKAFKKN